MRTKHFAGIVLASSLLTSCAGGGNSTSLPPANSSNLGAGAAPSAGIPKQYAVTDLGADIIPTAVNDAGEVAGGSGSTAYGCMERCYVTDSWEFTGGSRHVLPIDATFSYATALDINNSGIVAGSEQQEQAPYNRRAVLWKPDGTIENLGLGLPTAGLDATTADAHAISDTGIVAGEGGNGANGEWQPVIFDGNGAAHNPCGQYNGFTIEGTAVAVNNSGVVVVNSMYILDAVVTCPPLQRIDPPPGAPYAPVANDMNDEGDVVGNYITVPYLHHAFINHNGTATDLGTLFPTAPKAESSALAINNAGTIVGVSYQELTVAGLQSPRGFIYAGGKMVDLNTLLPADCATWTVTEATDISQNGKIAAVVYIGGYPNGKEHAVLLKPVQ